MLNTVFNEDCLEGMKRIPEKSIDMILCDLPYGTTACKWDVIIPFEPLWEQYERVIKDNGAIVLTASQPFTSALVMSNPSLFKYSWIYRKQQGTGFLNAKKMPLIDHEDVLVFYKKLPVYNPQMQEAKVFRPGIKKAKENDLSDYVYRSGIIGKTSWEDNGKRYPKTVLENLYDKERFDATVVNRANRHPTQKPVALFEYLIKTYTNEGETVLDNCMGSGTTAIACINTNRNYIGFEKEEKYYNIIQERIKKHTPQLKIAI
jgi:site-specific DNA-methyltransferase (adenine-specific)